MDGFASAWVVAWFFGAARYMHDGGTRWVLSAGGEEERSPCLPVKPGGDGGGGCARNKS